MKAISCKYCSFKLGYSTKQMVAHLKDKHPSENSENGFHDRRRESSFLEYAELLVKQYFNMEITPESTPKRPPAKRKAPPVVKTTPKPKKDKKDATPPTKKSSPSGPTKTCKGCRENVAVKAVSFDSRMYLTQAVFDSLKIL